MARSIAWGYGIAGAVVAAAIIVVAATTVGLTEGADEANPTPVFGMESVPVAPGEDVVSSEIVTTDSGEQVEYVYVDAPAARGDDEDDDGRYEEDHEDDHDEDDD